MYIHVCVYFAYMFSCRSHLCQSPTALAPPNVSKTSRSQSTLLVDAGLRTIQNISLRNVDAKIFKQSA